MFFRTGFQTRFWMVAFVVFAAALWILKPILLPFLAGMAIAYFLNPVVDGLGRRGIARWLASLLVLASFAFVIAMIVLLILPLIENQVGALVNTIPGYIEKFRAHFLPWIENWLSRFSPEDVDKIRDAAGQYAGNAAGLAGHAVGNVISGGLALIDLIALLVITPVVAFYLMRDWLLLVDAVDSFIPRAHYAVIKEQLAQIDSSLSGFMRGQALVCLALGLIYGVGLTAVGLQYGAVIGLIAGILSFIPYVGTIFAFVVSIILALVQFDHLSQVGFVVIALLVGQVMESYVLTPRLVGQRVGLHPVWILFAIIAGGRLLGFSGILIAVPMAAVIGVLVRFAIQQYKVSSLYTDAMHPPPKPPTLL